jgi:hypothetical protein
VRRLANDLSHKHELRATDALQLGSALVWCSQVPRRRLFITLDQQLARAAGALGFDVKP